jgi:hypothetical protein
MYRPEEGLQGSREAAPGFEGKSSAGNFRIAGSTGGGIQGRRCYQTRSCVEKVRKPREGRRISQETRPGASPASPCGAAGRTRGFGRGPGRPSPRGEGGHERSIPGVEAREPWRGESPGGQRPRRGLNSRTGGTVLFAGSKALKASHVAFSVTGTARACVRTPFTAPRQDGGIDPATGRRVAACFASTARCGRVGAPGRLASRIARSG